MTFTTLREKVRVHSDVHGLFDRLCHAHTLQHTAILDNALDHSAAHRVDLDAHSLLDLFDRCLCRRYMLTPLHHTAIHCNMCIICNTWRPLRRAQPFQSLWSMPLLHIYTAPRRSTQHYIALHCSTLQHTATHRVDFDAHGLLNLLDRCLGRVAQLNCCLLQPVAVCCSVLQCV